MIFLDISDRFPEGAARPGEGGTAPTTFSPWGFSRTYTNSTLSGCLVRTR
jgi:hypothetical protein